jgi:site-specific DNA-methyltransferase (adenine-specific)
MNQVLHGDCLELMKDAPSGSVDMILCDLPYGTTDCKWDTIIPFEPLWEQYKRIIKSNGAIVLTASQPFTSALVMSNVKMFRYEWIWEKDQGRNFQLAKHQPLKITESVCVYYSSQPTYNPQGLIKLANPIIKSNKRKAGRIGHMSSGTKRDFYEQWFTNYPENLIKINSERGLHPTQKPVALFEYLIKTYTNEGETVMDNCAGSGTTAIACINTNRNYILMEKDDTYYQTILKRIENHTPQLKIAI